MKLVDIKFQKSLQTTNGVFKKKIESQLTENEQFLHKI